MIVEKSHSSWIFQFKKVSEGVTQAPVELFVMDTINPGSHKVNLLRSQVCPDFPA